MTDLEAYREFMRNPSLDPQSTPVDLASAFSAGCQHARQQILDFTKPIPHQETATEVIAEARRERYDGVFAKPHRDTERLYWLANNQHQWGCITRRAKELAGPAWEALLMAIDEHMDPPATP